jgi:hypothetical protein
MAHGRDPLGLVGGRRQREQAGRVVEKDARQDRGTSMVDVDLWGAF